MLTPLERADKLKAEADQLLQDIQLEELCREIGKPMPTGSYFLDTMVYPDIDLYLPPATPTQLLKIGAYLAENHPVTRVNFLNGGSGPLKDALYIKPVIAAGDWERPWKIDIWAVEELFIAEKNAELLRFKEKMTPPLRELIIEYKYSILNEEYRTPMFSGYYVYQAVFDHSMRDYGEITAYLRENGIKV